MAIKVKVRSLFKGMVGINEKYYNEAEKNEDSLMIEYNSEFMELEFGDIDMEVESVSEETYPDQFGGKPYKLLYYRWKPQIRQQTLL